MCALNLHFIKLYQTFFLSFTKTNNKNTHEKNILEEQWKQLVHEKESALRSAENRLRIKMEDADNKLR